MKGKTRPPKVDLSPIFTDTLKKVAPLACLTLSISSDLTTERLFSPYCTEKVKVGNFLIEVLQKIPATKDNLDLRWSMLCTIGSLSIVYSMKVLLSPNSKYQNNFFITKVQNDFSSEMAINDFTALKDPIKKQIMPYMSKSHNKINDKVAHDVSFYLVVLRNERPGIFYNILPLLTDLFENIRFDRIFKAINIEIISLFTTSPIEFFSTLDGQFCEEKNYPMLFSYPLIFTAPEFTHFLQTTLILETYPYPIPFYGNLNNSIYCSLLNSSIEKHQHNIDLIAEIVMEAIVNADIENVKKSTCMFPELLPYFLIVNQSLMYSELESFIDLLETQYPPSPAANLIGRFKNDFHLIQFMSMLTGTNVCSGDLLVNSIPYHLNNLLNKKTDDILAASKVKYFSISDKDAEMDFDYIRARAAFRIVIGIIDKTITIQHMNESLEKMYNYINYMQNKVSKINLIIDIFSLIFLTNKKDNSFACTPYIAYKLVSKLVIFDSTEYIGGAKELFLKKKPKKSDQSLEPWLERDISPIYKAIESQDWETSKNLTLYLPNYKKIYTRAYDAYRYLHDGIVPWKNQDLIKLNVGLSHFGYRDVLKSIESQFPAYSSILEERIRSQDSINPIPTSDKWVPVEGFVNMFDTSSLDMVKKIPDFLSTLTISKSLYTFLDHICIYYACAKCGNYFHANTIEDFFVFDIYKAFAGPIEVGEYQKAQQLAKEANIDLIDFIFENLNFFHSFDEVFIDKMYEKSPAATNALLLSLLHPSLLLKNENENKDDEDMTHEEDFRKTYSKIVLKNNELNKVSQYLSLFEEDSKANEQNSNTEDNESLISQILSQNDQNLVDDLIFNVDHTEVYDYLMSRGNYSEEKLATSLYYIFNIVSYVAPESDYEKIDRINVQHKARQYSSARIPAEIIRDIMLNNDFDLALRYLKICVPPAETASPLCQLFTSSLSASEKSNINQNLVNSSKSLASSPSFASLTSLTFVDDILTAFPERFDVILSRFFHIPGIIKTLCKYAPEDKKDYMKGLSHLPELIFSDSNIFSIDTIVDSYIRNYQYIFDITPEIAKLFNDGEIFTMIKGVYENMVSPYLKLNSNNDFHNLEYISIFNNICVYLYSFFNDKNILIDFWISYVENTLKKFNIINSAQIEWNLNYYFKKLQVPLRLFRSIARSKDSKESLLLEMINSISLLASYFPFSRFGISYGFNNYEFNSPQFGNEIVSISTKIDEDQLVKELSKYFDINLDCYFLNKVKIQFNFYEYEDGRQTLKENSLKIDQYDKKVQLFDTTFSFLTPFNKLHFVLQKDLSLASDPEKLRDKNFSFTMNIYSNLKQKVNQMKQMRLHLQNREFVDEELLSMMYKVIIKYCRKDAAISMLISFKQFLSAYNILMKEKDQDQMSKLFIHSFLVAVQFNNTNEYFKKFLYEKDPNLDQTFKLWKNAIEFFKEKSMPYHLENIYMIRNQLEDASLIEVELFKDCQSFEKQVKLLGQIIYNLETSLNYRKKPVSHSPPFITNAAISTNDLQTLMEKSILQLNICSLLIERGIPFSHDFDIITSMDGATSVAAILYLNNSKELLSDLLKLAKIPQREVTSKVCEVLSNEPPNKVIEFWNNLKKHKDSLGANIPFELLKALAMSANRGLVYIIIMQFFSSDKEKCLLMLEYGYVVEAYALALSAGMKDIIPLIGKRAALVGDINIYDNCVKLLAKKK